ncbi:hypothetical protein LIER_38458 [Lithospermum erythrorhizon]|uniref:Uncharacterized protein n=1 Tax=Lithospermum erythrorhizon TaxID=34254 RepID=A0AAV3Q031_LITER
MIFIGVVWLLQETTSVKILRYVILFIGVMNSLFSVYGKPLPSLLNVDTKIGSLTYVFYNCVDIYDDTISRRVNSSDAEKFAEVCPCPCNGVAWGVIWGMISFVFLCIAMYLGLVILS